VPKDAPDFEWLTIDTTRVKVCLDGAGAKEGARTSTVQKGTQREGTPSR
jgi:hypothetical protein